jgi:isopentenyl-diphosphate delta-isomerase
MLDARKYVITVDENDNETGRMEKMEAHISGSLHRAFSIFILNSAGELLLQRRAEGKYHSAGLWTNTCCSHPMPGELTPEAAKRRLQEEMGFSCPLSFAFSFTYKADVGGGLTEHELDHVFTGQYEGPVVPAPEEVAEWKYISMEALAEELETNPEQYTSWLKIVYARFYDHVKTKGR